MREKIKARTVQSGRGKRAGQFLRALFHRKIVLVGSIGTVFFVLIALFAPLVAPYDPNVIDKGAYLLGMSPLHPWARTCTAGTFSRAWCSGRGCPC